jgi:transglutaminase-like putative cysteine protease
LPVGPAPQRGAQRVRLDGAGYERVEAIRQWVQSRTKFQVGSSHPGTSRSIRTNAATGVCRDFAHLMITMCRALNIPGAPRDRRRLRRGPGARADRLPLLRRGYLGDRWYIFDPSGISPRMG